MNKEELLRDWLAEESVAHIHGWDFSHIKGRYEEVKSNQWNYRSIVTDYLTPDKKVLDIDTGGAEFLLSLNHPNHNLAATENYVPNVELCKNKLLPLGVSFKQADASKELPFKDDSFDLIINRHGDFNAEEIWRTLKPGGIFITEQVGAENERELVELLLDKVTPLPFPDQYLSIIQASFEKRGFHTLQAKEVYEPIRFYDVGALVWFAHIIEWEFPNFNVTDCLNQLYHAQEIVEQKGMIEGRIHRFLLVVQK